MSTFLQENTREANILKQLEIDNSINENEIELALSQIKDQFDKFRKELDRSEEETIAKIHRMKEENYLTYSKKKKDLFEYLKVSKEMIDHDSFPSFERRIFDIEKDLGLVMQFSLNWRKDRLSLDKICEIHKSETKNSNKFYKIPLSYEVSDLKQTLFNSRPHQSLLPSDKINFTTEMHVKARTIVENKQQKYSILPIYRIILQSLNARKSIGEIRQGIFFLSKYPLCLFMDPTRGMFSTIKTQSNYHTDYVQAKLENFEVIFQEMEFQYQPLTQNYQINPNALSNSKYFDKLASICCELLLAYEELVNYEANSQEIGPQPIAYFSKKVPPMDLRRKSEFIPPVEIDLLSPQEKFERFFGPDSKFYAQSQKVEGEKLIPKPFDRQNLFTQTIPRDLHQFDTSAFHCVDNHELYSLNERVNSPEGKATEPFKFTAFQNKPNDLYPRTDKDTWY